MNEETELYLSIKYNFHSFNSIDGGRIAFSNLPFDYFEEYGRVYWSSNYQGYRIGTTSDDYYSHKQIRKEVLKRLYEYDRRRETVSSTEVQPSSV